MSHMEDDDDITLSLFWNYKMRNALLIDQFMRATLRTGPQVCSLSFPNDPIIGVAQHIATIMGVVLSTDPRCHYIDQ